MLIFYKLLAASAKRIDRLCNFGTITVFSPLCVASIRKGSQFGFNNTMLVVPLNL